MYLSIYDRTELKVIKMSNDVSFLHKSGIWIRKNKSDVHFPEALKYSRTISSDYKRKTLFEMPNLKTLFNNVLTTEKKS